MSDRRRKEVEDHNGNSSNNTEKQQAAAVTSSSFVSCHSRTGTFDPGLTRLAVRDFALKWIAMCYNMSKKAIVTACVEREKVEKTPTRQDTLHCPIHQIPGFHTESGGNLHAVLGLVSIHIVLDIVVAAALGFIFFAMTIATRHYYTQFTSSSTTIPGRTTTTTTHILHLAFGHDATVLVTVHFATLFMAILIPYIFATFLCEK
jgi:hypothetical protein